MSRCMNYIYRQRGYSAYTVWAGVWGKHRCTGHRAKEATILRGVCCPDLDGDGLWIDRHLALHFVYGPSLCSRRNTGTVAHGGCR